MGDRARRRVSARHGLVGGLRLRDVGPDEQDEAGMGGDLLAGGDVLPLSVVGSSCLWPAGRYQRAGAGLGRARLCQLRQPVLRVLRLQRRDGHGRGLARGSIDAVAAVRDRCACGAR